MAKKDKKKAKQQDDYWDTEFQEDAAVADATTSQEPDQSTEQPMQDDPVMEDLVDNFGGLMAAIKKSKGKKGKKPQAEMVDANEELEVMDNMAAAGASGDIEAAVEKEAETEETGEFRVKTKKEKEKEKKEKEKAKKKAQACS